jgi:hypothetical protein
VTDALVLCLEDKFAAADVVGVVNSRCTSRDETVGCGTLENRLRDWMAEGPGFLDVRGDLFDALGSRR